MLNRIIAIIGVGIVAVVIGINWLSGEIKIEAPSRPPPPQSLAAGQLGYPTMNAPYGQTIPYKAQPGGRVRFHGPKFTAYCVHTDGTTVEEPAAGCDLSRVEHQYAVDKSGQANSITYQWIDPK